MKPARATMDATAELVERRVEMNGWSVYIIKDRWLRLERAPRARKWTKRELRAFKSLIAAGYEIEGGIGLGYRDDYEYARGCGPTEEVRQIWIYGLHFDTDVVEVMTKLGYHLRKFNPGYSGWPRGSMAEFIKETRLR